LLQVSTFLEEHEATALLSSPHLEDATIEVCGCCLCSVAFQGLARVVLASLTRARNWSCQVLSQQRIVPDCVAVFFLLFVLLVSNLLSCS
jgi:hypothetical protein